MTRPASADVLEARFGHAVAARLTLRTEASGADIAERLRHARERALEAGRRARTARHDTVRVGAGGTAALARRGGWGWRMASVLPILALVAGLVLIQEAQDRRQVAAAADVDAALLGDDLPLSAYKDPGFIEFLRDASPE